MKIFTIAIIAGLLLASCAPLTPDTRIQQNPSAFSTLPTKHQELVRKGQITRGMSRDAVHFAWGEPSSRFVGRRENHLSERWDYASSRPVYSEEFFGGLTYGYGPYRHHGLSSLGFGVGPQVTYIPYRVASVWFLDDRVDSWESMR